MEYNKYKGLGLTGLGNLGNTCFLNSTLQCISHTYEFNEYLESKKWMNTVNEETDSLLLIEWDNLRKMMWEENCVISPGRFVGTVQKIASIKKRDLFTGFAQNDLPEFLLFLMDCFHNSIRRKVTMNVNGKIKNKKDKIAKDCYTMIKNMYSKDYSEIIEMFYGIHVSSVYNTENELLNNTPEPYFLLSLPIPQDKNEPTLYDCFDLYTESETLIGDNQYSYKDTKIDAQREIKFWSFPKILVIDLKRFNASNRKNQKLVNIPLDKLDLSNYCIGYNKSQYIYELYGICNHSGGVMGGHYTSYVKNASGVWYHFNDTSVQKIEDESKLITNKAYCLFFRKKNIE